jgi:hypothetical protein
MTLLQNVIKTAEMVPKNEMIKQDTVTAWLCKLRVVLFQKKVGKIMTLFITTRPMASQATLEDKNVSHLVMSRAQHKHDHGPDRH